MGNLCNSVKGKTINNSIDNNFLNQINSQYSTIKCNIQYNETIYSVYYKSNTILNTVKQDICKRIKKDKNKIVLEIKDKQIVYENIELHYFIKNVLEEIIIKVKDIIVLNNNNTEDNNNLILKKGIDSEKIKINLDTEKVNHNMSINNNNILSKYNSNSSKSENIKSNNINNNSSFNLNNNNNNNNNQFISNINNIDNNTINIISKYCPIHNDKSTIICQTCAIGICSKCKEDLHKEHSIISKSDIIEYSKVLFRKEQELLRKLKLIDVFDTDFSIYFKTFKIKLNKYTDELFKIAEIVKTKQSEIINNFKNNIDSNLPSLLCYKENINKLNKDFANNVNNYISDDKKLIKYYQDYLIFNTQSDEIIKNIDLLRLNIKDNTLLSNEFQSKINELCQYGYEQIQKLEEFQLYIINNNNNYDNYINNDLDDIENHVNKQVKCGTTTVLAQPNNIDYFNSNKLSSVNTNQDHNNILIENFVTNNNNINRKINAHQINSIINNYNNSSKQNNNNNCDVMSISNFNNTLKTNAANTNNNNNSIKKSIINNNNNVINLKTLMETPNKNLSDILKKPKVKSFNTEINTNSNTNNIMSEIIDKNLSNTNKDLKIKDIVSSNYIYSIESGSNNLFVYNCDTNTISKTIVDLKETSISKFHSFHSYLNYNNNFYVCGNGFNSKRLFIMLDNSKLVSNDINNKQLSINYSMKQLPDMINNHSFHSMLGINNYILVISGHKTKKVDMFLVDDNNYEQDKTDSFKWINMPDLNYSRNYASSLFKNDTGIYVFGGSLNNYDEDVNKNENDNNNIININNANNIIIEKLNIKDLNNLVNFHFNDSKTLNIDSIKLINWETICINNTFSINPYSGFLYSYNNDDNSNKILIFGGKSKVDEDNSESLVFSLDLDNLTLNKYDIEIDYPDDFDGKCFVYYCSKNNDNSINDSNNEINEKENNLQTNKNIKYGLFCASNSRFHYYCLKTNNFNSILNNNIIDDSIEN